MDLTVYMTKTQHALFQIDRDNRLKVHNNIHY